MDKEDRELRIKIAQLQSNIQFYLTVAIGFIASTVGFLIAGYQVGIDMLETHSTPRVIVFITFGVLSIASAMIAQRYLNKLKLSRKELLNLK